MDILNCSTAEKSVEGVRMPLYKPGTKQVLTHTGFKGAKDKTPTEMFLTVLGPESQELRRALLAIQNRIAERPDDYEPTQDDIQAEALADSKVLAQMVVGGQVFMGGKWLKVDGENAVDVFLAVASFRTQAIQFASNAGNFIKG